MQARSRCAVSPGWRKDWVVAGLLSQKLKLLSLGWESHCLRMTSTAHTMDPAARAHIPQPCQVPLCAARLWTEPWLLLLAAGPECAGNQSLQCPLPFPSLFQKARHVLCLHRHLEKGVSPGHCYSEREALHHTDAAPLTKKPRGRKRNKLVISHDQNWEYILLIAWARVFGQARQNLSTVFAHGKNNLIFRNNAAHQDITEMILVYLSLSPVHSRQLYL